MFTTGNHIYLYLSFGGYVLACGASFAGFLRTGRSLLLAGLIMHAAYLLGRGWLGGVFIANPIVEGPFFLPFCISLLALAMGVKDVSGRWKNILPLLLVFMFLSVIYAKGMIPPTPKKISPWAILFFVSESAAHALFYISAVFAAIFLVRPGSDKQYRTFIVWGVVAYTISQITGAVWSFMGWGNTFNWSPRHLSSASIWMVYLAILHVKFIPGWGHRQESFLTVFSGFYVFFVSFGHYLKEMNFPRIGG